MTINKKSVITLLFLIFIFLLAAAGWFLIQNQKNKRVSDEKDSSGNPPRIQIIDGVTTIDLTPEEQINSGITTERLNSTSHQAQYTAFGTVVSIKDLSSDVQSFETAKAQLVKSEENILISQKNFERIKNLYGK